jgi:hypothetical protein
VSIQAFGSRFLCHILQISGKGKADHSAKYFSHSDEAAKEVREKLAAESLDCLIEWLKAEGNVGIMGELPQLLIQYRC